jgi:hypothetical protein
MFNEDILMLNNKAYSNNNNILLDIINKLQNIVNDLYFNKEINNIIYQIKNIIIIMNNVINNNKKNTEEIRKDISKLHKDMINQFNNLKLNNNNSNNIDYIINKLKFNILISI